MKNKNQETIISCMNEIEKHIPKKVSKRNVELSLQILNNIRKVKT